MNPQPPLPLHVNGWSGLAARDFFCLCVTGNSFFRPTRCPFFGKYRIYEIVSSAKHDIYFPWCDGFIPSLHHPSISALGGGGGWAFNWTVGSIDVPFFFVFRIH